MLVSYCHLGFVIQRVNKLISLKWLLCGAENLWRFTLHLLKPLLLPIHENVSAGARRNFWMLETYKASVFSCMVASVTTTRAKTASFFHRRHTYWFRKRTVFALCPLFSNTCNIKLNGQNLRQNQLASHWIGEPNDALALEPHL